MVEQTNVELVNADDQLDVFQLLLSSSQQLIELTFHQSLPNDQYLSIRS